MLRCSSLLTARLVIVRGQDVRLRLHIRGILSVRSYHTVPHDLKSEFWALRQLGTHVVAIQVFPEQASEGAADGI